MAPVNAIFKKKIERRRELIPSPDLGSINEFVAARLTLSDTETLRGQWHRREDIALQLHELFSRIRTFEKAISPLIVMECLQESSHLCFGFLKGCVNLYCILMPKRDTISKCALGIAFSCAFAVF